MVGSSGVEVLVAKKYTEVTLFCALSGHKRKSNTVSNESFLYKLPVLIIPTPILCRNYDKIATHVRNGTSAVNPFPEFPLHIPFNITFLNIGTFIKLLFTFA